MRWTFKWFFSLEEVTRENNHLLTQLLQFLLHINQFPFWFQRDLRQSLSIVPVTPEPGCLSLILAMPSPARRRGILPHTCCGASGKNLNSLKHFLFLICKVGVKTIYPTGLLKAFNRGTYLKYLELCPHTGRVMSPLLLLSGN